MTSDRFADLGSGTRASDRLAELDETDPEPRRPRAPERRGRYLWVVGVAVVIAIVAATLNSLGNVGAGTNGPPAGKPLPRFAAPSATGPVDLDANINQTASDPAPGRTPACSVHVPGTIRSCDYTSKPLVITVVSRTGACERLLTRVDRMRSAFPSVNFLAVITASSKAQAAQLVRDNGWREPVALDRNGALITLYRVSFCGTMVFAYRGGIVRTTQLRAQDWTDAQLAAAIRATAAR